MKKLVLNRQNHNEPNFKSLKEMIWGLKMFLAEDVNTGDEAWGENFNTIICFQDNDGSFKLLDSFEVESDARVDFCYMPTYICSAIIMKAFMTAPNTIAGKESALSRALTICCSRKLSGHGYDGLAGTLEALTIFREAGLREFLMYRANICPEFNDMIHKIAAELKNREDKADTKGLWGEDYKEEIHSHNEYFSHSIAFVYGTLMKGERNHDWYLNDNAFLGKAEIAGFDMYDIGTYPAIVPGKGSIKGELYKITEDDLRKIDCLEGEGNLYIRQFVPATIENGGIAFAHVYVYNQSTDNLVQIHDGLQSYTADWKNSTASNC